MNAATDRIVQIALDDHSIVRRRDEVEREREAAMTDLLQQNSFAPVGAPLGPYAVELSVQEGRLILAVRPEVSAEAQRITLSLQPLRRVIRDYFMICEAYYDAVKSASPARLEAIDMGRRGVHNEGSELLTTLLEGKIALDFDTARRLFTLICVLHIK